MAWSVEVAYPAPISAPLDHRLEQLAANHAGQWTGSGMGLVKGIAERDIEFCFEDETAARKFAQQGSRIDSVKILSVSEEPC